MEERQSYTLRVGGSIPSAPTNLGNDHDPGCPAIADDESDYEYLDDAGMCVCSLRDRIVGNPTGSDPVQGGSNPSPVVKLGSIS